MRPMRPKVKNYMLWPDQFTRRQHTNPVAGSWPKHAPNPCNWRMARGTLQTSPTPPNERAHDMDASQDPSAGAGAAAPGDDSGANQGYTIEIKVAGNGSMTYSVEPGAEEDSEEQGEGAEPSGTPVKGMADLMSKIKETIANGGASPESSDADFNAGYAGGDAGAGA